jgi:hypothetical protein
LTTATFILNRCKTYPLAPALYCFDQVLPAFFVCALFWHNQAQACLQPDALPLSYSGINIFSNSHSTEMKTYQTARDGVNCGLAAFSWIEPVRQPYARGAIAFAQARRVRLSEWGGETNSQ